jgi:hypothetical protein
MLALNLMNKKVGQDGPNRAESVVGRRLLRGVEMEVYVR